jgi:hypothetical protein
MADNERKDEDEPRKGPGESDTGESDTGKSDTGGEREGVEEVEATPVGQDERAEGPTIDAPPKPGQEPPIYAGFDSNQWAMLAHLSGLIVLPTAGFGGVIGPVIVWLLRSGDPRVVTEAKEAVNFQLNVLAWMILASVITGVFSFCIYCFALAIPLAVWVYSVALTVIAALSAREGRVYRYPGILRLVE